MSLAINIPRPCHVDAGQLTPTATGWHCAACQTPVIDFSRLTEAEILAYLAAPGRSEVCARISTGPRPVPAASRSRVGRWLALALALLGLRTAAATAPPANDPTRPAPPVAAKTGSAQLAGAEAGQPVVTIRGQVLDDSLHVPVAGAHIFVANTPYGAVTDAQGRFELPIPVGRPEVRSGTVRLQISAGHFTFLPQTIAVAVRPAADPAAVVVRLQSIPERGHIMGRVKPQEPPRRF